MTEPEQWYVHTLGPDDIEGPYSIADAFKHALDVNSNMIGRALTDDSFTVWAVPTRSPHGTTDYRPNEEQTATEPDARQTTQPGVTEEEVMRRVDASVGKPPRIEDMTPGTTFSAAAAEDVWRWAVRADGLIVSGLGVGPMSALDPSTIRDVQPPAVTS